MAGALRDLLHHGELGHGHHRVTGAHHRHRGQHYAGRVPQRRQRAPDGDHEPAGDHQQPRLPAAVRAPRDQRRGHHAGDAVHHHHPTDVRLDVAQVGQIERHQVEEQAAEHQLARQCGEHRHQQQLAVREQPQPTAQADLGRAYARRPARIDGDERRRRGDRGERGRHQQRLLVTQAVGQHPADRRTAHEGREHRPQEARHADRPRRPIGVLSDVGLRGDEDDAVAGAGERPPRQSLADRVGKGGPHVSRDRRNDAGDEHAARRDAIRQRSGDRDRDEHHGHERRDRQSDRQLAAQAGDRRVDAVEEERQERT